MERLLIIYKKLLEISKGTNWKHAIWNITATFSETRYFSNAFPFSQWPVPQGLCHSTANNLLLLSCLIGLQKILLISSFCFFFWWCFLALEFKTTISWLTYIWKFVFHWLKASPNPHQDRRAFAELPLNSTQTQLVSHVISSFMPNGSQTLGQGWWQWNRHGWYVVFYQGTQPFVEDK